jgi:hypothetical protein
MVLASVESFLGSVWACGLCLVGGFIVGHFGLLSKWLKK